jgi:hypothetical protein
MTDERVAKFRVDGAIICDEIRREDTGKYLLIGVYAEGFALASFPGTATISVMVTGTSEGVDSGTTRLQIQAKTADNTIAARLEVGLRIKENENRYSLSIPLPQMRMQLSGPTNVTLFYRNFPQQEEWLPIRVFPITKLEQPPPNTFLGVPIERRQPSEQSPPDASLKE